MNAFISKKFKNRGNQDVSIIINELHTHISTDVKDPDNTFVFKPSSDAVKTSNVFAPAKRESKATLLEGKPVPDFSIQGYNEGETFEIKNYKGKVVMLDFWATWCKPCWKAIPSLIKMQEDLHKKGFAILSILMDKNAARFVPGIVKKAKLNYPLLIGTPELQKTYNVRGFPTYILIDQNGIVRYWSWEYDPQEVIHVIDGLLALTDVEGPAGRPIPGDGNKGIWLSRLGPNPFRSGMEMRFHLPEPASFHLTVHDLTGRVVRTLASGAATAVGPAKPMIRL